MYIRSYCSLLLLSFGAVQAHNLIVVNNTNQNVHGRVKVQLVGIATAKKGSVHFQVNKGESVACDLTTVEKWVRSTTECDPEKSTKGKKLGREAIAPKVGAIKEIKLVKIKAKSTTSKGRAKISSQKQGILRLDLITASCIIITEQDGKLVFNNPQHA